MATPSFTFRLVEECEQPSALALWNGVFEETPGYFERYYRADLGYREGDTLGAWIGTRLVSAVHLCRRRTFWNGEVLLCGGVANVATLPEFRRRGLSRRLLEMMVAQMERENLHFSLLGTGVPEHYAALGWELTHAPRATIALKSDVPALKAGWHRLGPTAALPPLYAAHPRPLQFDRTSAYFDAWVGWNWRRFPTYLCRLPGRGYLVLVASDDPDETIFATEWRAEDAAAEQELLQSAAAEVLRQGRTQLGLEALPQFAEAEFLNTLGTVTVETDPSSMVRNLGLPKDKYRQLAHSYRTGEAVWWSADGF